MNTFQFLTPSKVLFGENRLDIIKEKAGNSGSDILFVTDKGVTDAGLTSKFIETAGLKQGLTIINSIPTEPYSTDLDTIAQELDRKDFKLIVALGGGSVMDSAKLLSVMLRTGMTVGEIRTQGVAGKGIPTFMIPTTAGTGSEATPNAIVAFKEEEIKMGIVSEYFMPDYVLLDPSLTTSLPAKLTASTGIDALCHVLECYIATKSNPYSDTMALKGAELIFANIEKAFMNGSDIEARGSMLLGSYYGGACIASSGTTAVHALSYPLGGKYRIPHGVSNAILLAPVFEFNADAVPEKMIMIGRAAGLSDPSPEKTVQYLKDLVKRLEIPASLEYFNVPRSDIPYLVEKAFGVKRLLDNNPKEMTTSDIRKIYETLY